MVEIDWVVFETNNSEKDVNKMFSELKLKLKKFHEEGINRGIQASQQIAHIQTYN